MYRIQHFVPYEGTDDIFSGTLEEVEDWFRKGLPVNQNHIYGGPWVGYCLDHLEIIQDGPSVFDIMRKVKEIS